MKKYIIILMFAVITPATQSCLQFQQFLNQVIFNGITHQCSQNNTWSWLTPGWTNFENVYIPWNSYWYGYMDVPLPYGYRNARVVGNPYVQNNRCYISLQCDGGRYLNYSFTRGSNRIRWY